MFKKKYFTRPEIINDTVNFYDEDGKTCQVYYAKFFQQEGFIRITREGNDRFTILINDRKIVLPINHLTDVVAILKANINEFDPTELENKIAREATNIIQQSFQLLTPIKEEYHKDTKTRCDLPFKNGVVRIKKDSIELISYDEIDGFFAKHDTQNHEITFIEHEANKSEYAQFLIMAIIGREYKDGELTTKERFDVGAFFSMFGYLLTNYKDHAFNPAIILSDMGADDVSRNGGRGKSLVQSALSKFRVSIEKGGTAYDPNYTHVHADMKKEHDLYILDDVPAKFPYNSLYTHLTGFIDAQRKGVTAETIPFEDAPKFVISTNYAVRFDKNADSTNRRFTEYQFSSFWNIKNKPSDYFGKTFFSDWSADEWNEFYNFGFMYVQHYYKHGLEIISYDKEADNFRAYFYNEAILDEVERIFIYLCLSSSFKVADFLTEHKANSLSTYKPEFTIRNARKFIEAFIEFKKLPYSYSKHSRRWEKIG